MKIALLCDEYPPRLHGGIGTFVNVYAHGLAAAGHGVTVVETGAAAAEREDGPVHVLTMPRWKMRVIGGVQERIRRTAMLDRMARDHAIDIIETPDWLGPMPFALRYCPVVVRLHLPWTVQYALRGMHQPRGLRYWENRTLRTHPNWIAVSQFILTETQRVFGCQPRRSAVIYNPLPPLAEPLPPVETPARFFLYCGHMSLRKRPDAVAEAAVPLLRQYPDLHLVFIGNVLTEEGQPMDQRIEALLGPELATRALFLGYQPRAVVAAWMARATAFVFVSKVESYGLVLVEAMAQGACVVANDMGPFDEILTHEKTGLLVAPNDPAALTATLARVLGNPAEATALGAAARAEVSHGHSVEDNVRQSIAFYNACLGGAAAVNGQPPTAAGPAAGNH